ncbi:MAG: hypothetical protein JNK15_06895 [Planctomycetes bacterium]|nr:hypothetical protein [Planctomycetota bacterium]
MRWPALALAFAIAAIVFLVFETRDLAEQLGRAEVAARAADRAAAEAHAATAQAAAEPAPAAAPAMATPASAGPSTDALAFAQLQLELHSTQQQLAAVKALLEQRNAEAEARAAERSRSMDRPPMPEGVRLCLVTLQQVLHEEGFPGVRFLQAGRLAGDVLEDVEVLVGDAAGLEVTFYVCKRLTGVLDRGTGDLELRLYEGLATAGGTSTKLPDDGLPLVFRGLDGRRLEQRLPYFVRGEGVHPDMVAESRRKPTDVDASVRRLWLERFDVLLAASGTTPTWRLNRFRGMQDGWFLDCELVGTDAKNHVVAGAHCQRLAVEVDAASATVSLRLVDGVLRRGALESSITGEGYRMLLPKRSPNDASQAMVGMVVSK